jgi:hypothetical protein
MKKNITKQELELSESYSAESLFMALTFQQQQKMINQLIDRLAKSKV